MSVEYLSALAAHRFNRFNLTFGIGYNSCARHSRFLLLSLAYPFLLPVPGYNVRATGLPDAERDRNLETLRFISERGRSLVVFPVPTSPSGRMRMNGPIAKRTTESRACTPQTHAPYCRDGLAAVLKACPKITGLSVRMHGESGIPDGDYEFWETLFQAIKPAGRRIDLDLHAKGTDQRHIAIARSTGMPVSMAPKFWAEHMGMPYHQAAIREEEMRPARPGEPRNAATTRRFLRYGYGDYIEGGPEIRDHPPDLAWNAAPLVVGRPRHGCRVRIRFQLLGQPRCRVVRTALVQGAAWAAASRAAGTRTPTNRSIRNTTGRSSTINIECGDGWSTILKPTRRDGGVICGTNFRALPRVAEMALSHASRVLPVITPAHGASGSNHSYWPEMYMNMPIVDPGRAQPYRDTPEPRTFGTVGAFDPQMFSSVEECAAALVSGKSFAKYSPLDVAQWLEDMSAAASINQSQALARAPRGCARIAAAACGCCHSEWHRQVLRVQIPERGIVVGV